ncbi:MAG: penicillin-binding protein 2 [candidate division WOR-3 bacterium]
MEEGLKRFKTLRTALIICFSLILFFTLKLQIFEGKKYYRLSEENRIKKKYLTSQRGKIFDRNNREIANTRPGFYVSVIPALVDTASIEKISKILNIKREKITTRIMSEKNPFLSTKIAHDISFQQLSMIEEEIEDLRGIEVGVEPVRNYPYKDLFCHVLGYVAEITKEELKNYKEYKLGDYIGRTGLEKVYENHLKGRDGIEYIEVDVYGRELGKVGEYRPLPAQSGKDLFTTLDAELTESTSVFLSNFKKASAIALNPQNGEVYVLYSKPGFDPNLFIKGLNEQQWQTLNNPVEAPLINRAIMSLYPIGSTVKPIIALAALDAGLINPDKTFIPCKGVFYLGRRPFKCWKTHGQLRLVDAIIHSCDIYFYQLGRMIGIDIISQYLVRFGFGKTTDIDLTEENKGLVPDRKYLENKYGKNWTEGHIFNISIGQGDLLATPLQLACAYTLFANNGNIIIPHLIKKDKAESRQLVLSPRAIETIQQGLRGVVSTGTGILAQLETVDVCGKTGTAENPHGEDHSIFVGYAPPENPEILVCVVVENAGHGGSVAAPIAGKIIKTFFVNKGIASYK